MTQPNILILMVDQLNGTLFPDGPADWLHAPNLKRLAERSVSLVDETLFRTDVVLPANLTEGDYQVRMFLTRGGKVIDMQERVIGVRKAGLERFLYAMAHEQPLLYGLVSLLLAAIAGWAASAGFKLLRR